MYPIILNTAIAVSFLLLSTLPSLAQNTAQQQAMRLQQAMNYERVGQFDRAAQLFQSLFDEDPRNGTFYQGLKRTLLQVRQYERLLEIVQRRLEAVDDPYARIDAGDLLYKLNRQEEASAQWQQVLDQQPSKEIFVAVANAMISNRAYDDALAVYSSGRQRFNNDQLFALDLAEFYVQRGDFPKAAEEYLRHLSADPRQHPIIQRKLTELAEETAATPHVIQALESAIATSSNPAPLHRLLASIFLQMEDYPRAFREYQVLEELSQNVEKANVGNELFNFANEAQRASAYQHAEKAYLIIIGGSQKSPYYLPAMLGLGQCYKQQNKFQEAIEIFKAIVEKTGNNARNTWTLRALNEQGEIYFTHLNDVQRAIEIYKRIYNSSANGRNEERIAATFRLGDCYLALGDPREAANWYKQAQQFGDRNAMIVDKAQYSLAKLSYYQGQFREAQQQLEGIVAHKTGVEQGESMVNDALELLFLIENNIADSSGALKAFANAEYLSTQNRRQAAIDTLANLAAKYPDSDIAPQALVELGALQAKGGSYEDAANAYRAVLERYATSIVADQALFYLAAVQADHLRDYQGAKTLFEQLLKDYPNSLLVEEARKRARTLAEKANSL